MKNLILLLFLLGSIVCFSQPDGKKGSFTDSLTHKTQRTWYRTDGVRYNKKNKNCSFGIELTFIKKKYIVKMRKCVKGSWKQFQYYFRVVTNDENHYVEIFDDKNNVITKLEVQFLKFNDKFRTELTYYNLNAKEFYTLISDEH
jgi:hypothetical protein